MEMVNRLIKNQGNGPAASDAEGPSFGDCRQRASAANPVTRLGRGGA